MFAICIVTVTVQTGYNCFLNLESILTRHSSAYAIQRTVINKCTKPLKNKSCQTTKDVCFCIWWKPRSIQSRRIQKFSFSGSRRKIIVCGVRDRPRVDRGVFCLIGRGKRGKNFEPVGARGVKFSPRAPRGLLSGQIFSLHGLPHGLPRVCSVVYP